MYIRGKKISETSAMHYTKLVLRSFLFAICTFVYVYDRIHHTGGLFEFISSEPAVIWAIATVYIVEMSFRFFPSGMESKGCQKQFEINYKPTGTTEKPRIDNAVGTFTVVISWIGLNAVVAALYFMGIMDQGMLILLCLAYSVCDMICILFFCPFQTWMMKNKCCGTCRIYNWDFIMMFTPCILIDHPLAKILFFLAAALCLEWEILYHKYPERFAENTNEFLQCANCTEKLCSHKKQLQRYLVLFRKRLSEETGRIGEIIGEEKEKIEEKLKK